MNVKKKNLLKVKTMTGVDFSTPVVKCDFHITLKSFSYLHCFKWVKKSFFFCEIRQVLSALIR